MNIRGKDYRTVWMEGQEVCMIDQNLLPFEFSVLRCHNFRDACKAIRNMNIRGAGAIGAAAGYAMAQACLEAPAGSYVEFIETARKEIESTRPTARNLFYAVEGVFSAGMKSPAAACNEALSVADQDAADSRSIGIIGSELIKNGARILTHCNAGWLAFVDYGTALSPIYHAFRDGKDLFVYAGETRPRGQGARLTAWELNEAGVPHVIIPDNAAAYLMSLGKIDMVITGADRIACNGDAANKIGTLDRAIAAKEYGIPFYVAAPLSSFDFACTDGAAIKIEERNEDEVLFQSGPDSEGNLHRILVASPGSKALNPAFDVTPARLITAFITEKGIFKPEETGSQK